MTQNRCYQRDSEAAATADDGAGNGIYVAARPADVPPCFKVGCDNDDPKHRHVGPISKNERVVVTPRLVTAPGWAYLNPHGRYLGRDGIYSTVALDDGTTRRVSPQNVVRERLWKEPVLRRELPRPLHRPHKPLPEGPWQEEPMPFEEASR